MVGGEEVNKEKWIKAGLEISEHLLAISNIVNKNNIDILSMGVVNGGLASAYFMDGDGCKKDVYEVDIHKNNKVIIGVNGETCYTKV